MPLENAVLFGIPIPSANPLFLAGVAIHVLFGLAAIVAGACAMLLHKGRGRHSNFGIAYFWCLFGVFVTMSALAFSRWQEDYDLFILGALSFGAAWLGRTILQHRWQQWPRWHLTSMGASFILMITAFYVDNGKNLPLWRELPQIAFWFLPAMIGTPIILFVLRTHPLVIAYDRTLAEISNSGTTYSMKTADSGEQGRGWGTVAVGVFAILAGLGEIIVGITGNYLGILSKPLEPSAVTALVGACYALGGAFILTSKKWGAALGMALIAAEILGRIYLVATGVAPSSGPDAMKIAVGAAIALALIGYVASQWRRFH